MAFQLKLPFLPFEGAFLYNLILFLNRAVSPKCNLLLSHWFLLSKYSTVFHNFLRKFSCKMTLMIPLPCNIRYNKHGPSSFKKFQTVQYLVFPSFHVVWSNKEYYNHFLDGMLVHNNVTSQHFIRLPCQFPCTHLYSRLKRGAMKVIKSLLLKN